MRFTGNVRFFFWKTLIAWSGARFVSICSLLFAQGNIFLLVKPWMFHYMTTLDWNKKFWTEYVCFVSFLSQFCSQLHNWIRLLIIVHYGTLCSRQINCNILPSKNCQNKEVIRWVGEVCLQICRRGYVRWCPPKIPYLVLDILGFWQWL